MWCKDWRVKRSLYGRVSPPDHISPCDTHGCRSEQCYAYKCIKCSLFIPWCKTTGVDEGTCDNLVTINKILEMNEQQAAGLTVYVPLLYSWVQVIQSLDQQELEICFVVQYVQFCYRLYSIHSEDWLNVFELWLQLLGFDFGHLDCLRLVCWWRVYWPHSFRLASNERVFRIAVLHKKSRWSRFSIEN